MNDERRIRINNAENLLANELFNEVINSIEEKYLKMITDSDFSKQYERDFGYIGVNVIKDIKNYLQYIVKSGKLKIS